MDPFHPLEREAQRLAGVENPPSGAAIRNFMPDQHRQFFEALMYAFMGAADADGWPVATVLAGPPGFISSPDEHSLRITTYAQGDPVVDSLAVGSEVGLLGLDLSNRRRNRANGVVSARDQRGFSLDIAQSFGNCPQYIQTRVIGVDPAPPGPIETFEGLDAEAAATVAGADTFFVASRASGSQGGVDISHRGGLPGFVQIKGNVLTIPDYRGNRYFNTLGNLMAEPRAALLFVDFAAGDLLQLQGRAQIDWQGAGALPSAERIWRFEVARGQRRRAAIPLRWAFGEFSPFTLATAA